MSKVNFNSLKNIKAPQAWVDKAASIPEIAPKKRAAFPVYRAAAAASLVLASVIGIVAFMFFGSKVPISIREKGSGEVVSTEEDGSVSIPDDGSYPSLDSVFPTVPQFIPTDADGHPMIEATSEDGKKVPSATESNGTVSPSQKPAKTNVPYLNPTQGVSLPTQAITPTNPPAPTEPPASEIMQEPTEGYKPPGDTEFYGMFTLDDLGVVSGGYYAAEDATIFCRIYDSNGSLVGDSPLYSPQREAVIISRYADGTVVAYYNPAAKGLYLTEDVYEYIFYDVHGNDLYRDFKFVC